MIKGAGAGNVMKKPATCTLVNYFLVFLPVSRGFVSEPSEVMITTSLIFPPPRQV